MGRAPNGSIPSRPRRWSGSWLDFMDIPSLDNLGDVGTAVAVVVGAIIAVVLIWFLVIPLLLAVVDVVVLVLLALVAIIAHLVFRRPWEIEARSPDRRLVWLVGGWRESESLLVDVETALRDGREPPTPTRAGYRRS
jgi:hypothetical protein